VNGRESFLTGVDWVDDWPVVDEARFGDVRVPTSFEDVFGGPTLGPRWVSPGTDPAGFAHPTEPGLRLAPGREPSATDSVTLLATRVLDDEWEAVVEADGDLALVVRIDDRHWAGVERVGSVLSARAVVGTLDQTLAATDLPAGARPAVRVLVPETEYGRSTGPDVIELGYRTDAFHTLATLDGRYISTEVAGGFTGRVVGVEAIGQEAVVRSFRYSA
jgi:hypothetical protein